MEAFCELVRRMKLNWLLEVKRRFQLKFPALPQWKSFHRIFNNEAILRIFLELKNWKLVLKDLHRKKDKLAFAPANAYVSILQSDRKNSSSVTETFGVVRIESNASLFKAKLSYSLEWN